MATNYGLARRVGSPLVAIRQGHLLLLSLHSVADGGLRQIVLTGFAPAANPLLQTLPMWRCPAGAAAGFRRGLLRPLPVLAHHVVPDLHCYRHPHE